MQRDIGHVQKIADFLSAAERRVTNCGGRLLLYVQDAAE